MKRGQRVSVEIPHYRKKTGHLTTGKLCGVKNMSYRVKIDGLVTPWTVDAIYITAIKDVP